MCSDSNTDLSRLDQLLRKCHYSWMVDGDKVALTQKPVVAKRGRPYQISCTSPSRIGIPPAFARYSTLIWAVFHTVLFFQARNTLDVGWVRVACQASDIDHHGRSCKSFTSGPVAKVYISAAALTQSDGQVCYSSLPFPLASLSTPRPSLLVLRLWVSLEMEESVRKARGQQVVSHSSGRLSSSLVAV